MLPSLSPSVSSFQKKPFPPSPQIPSEFEEEHQAFFPVSHPGWGRLPPCLPEEESEVLRGKEKSLYHATSRRLVGTQDSPPGGTLSSGDPGLGHQPPPPHPQTAGSGPSLHPHTWPCKLALTFRAPAFELCPIHCETTKGERRAARRRRLLPALAPGATPLQAHEASGSVCTVGALAGHPTSGRKAPRGHLFTLGLEAPSGSAFPRR